jgi:AcrR family transcriptional regulator
MSAINIDAAETNATETRKGPVTAQDLMDAAVGLLDSHRSVSTLSLREIARAAGIAPNTFYRHFRDVDELTVALIDQAGRSLRGIIREARQRLSLERSAIRTSVEAFMDQLDADQRYLHVLLREMSTGSEAFRQAVDRELSYFEDELRDELEKIAEATGHKVYQPALAAKAITRLVVAMGANAADVAKEQRSEITEHTVVMIRMIMEGAELMAKKAAKTQGQL